MNSVLDNSRKNRILRTISLPLKQFISNGEPEILHTKTNNYDFCGDGNERNEMENLLLNTITKMTHTISMLNMIFIRRTKV